MRAVMTYITSDEQSFHSRDAALAHEAIINFTKEYASGKIRQIQLEKMKDNTSYVVDWLFHNREEILKLYGIGEEPFLHLKGE